MYCNCPFCLRANPNGQSKGSGGPDERLRELERKREDRKSIEAYEKQAARMGLEVCLECGKAATTLGECDCGTELCENCGIRCNNCEELRCQECARVCAECDHNHILCDVEGCNDEDEFMKKCDECERWFCRQCNHGSGSCFRNHEDDCYW